MYIYLKDKTFVKTHFIYLSLISVAVEEYHACNLIGQKTEAGGLLEITSPI